MFSCCCGEEKASQDGALIIKQIDGVSEVFPKEGLAHESVTAKQELPEDVVDEEPITYCTHEVDLKVTEATPLNLDTVAVTENHLLVREVLRVGAISRYNREQASSENRVQRCDRILSVNGEILPAEKLSAKLQAISGSVTLHVEKPSFLGVTITKDEQELGLDVQLKDDFATVISVISSINDGCIADYNKLASADRRVKVNDIIIGSFSKDAFDKLVVHKCGSPEEMMQHLTQRGTVSLFVMSYS
eukprot:TRINITY_DN97312_c0_g1_i1.p1 TRINITY_DN97312_c0_g1~~TRINITY_DN97312_c0_g1_i1.p1  ORF type:complete len:246 (-),score=40.26 TRINITY_DN97312_c0_g1_i1:232-969(-)